MTARTTPEFWRLFDRLPQEIQTLARKQYRLWVTDPEHPSLEFKRLKNSRFFSARINRNYRTLGVWIDDEFVWVWIGSHADYDTLLRRTR